MFGLPGFRVLAVSEYAGEVEQAVETTEEVTGCPSCGVLARLHERRSSWVRDLPAWPAGHVGVGDAGVALPRAAVREGDPDRDLRGDRVRS